MKKANQISKNQQILNAIEGAGATGILSSDIVKKTGVPTGHISAWWCTAGKKSGKVTRVGRGHYVWTAHMENEKKPQVSTKVLREFQASQKGTRIGRWTHDRQIANPEPGEGKPAFVMEAGHYTIVARQVAAEIWKNPIKESLLETIQRVTAHEDILKQVPRRYFTSMSQVTKQAGGPSLKEYILREYTALRELAEKISEPEIRTITVEKEPSVTEVLSKLSPTEKLNEFGKLVVEWMTEIRSASEYLKRFTLLGAQPVSNGGPKPQPMTVEKQRPVRIGLISHVAHEKLNELRRRVGDVLEIDHLDPKQGHDFIIKQSWNTCYSDSNHSTLNHLRQQAAAVLKPLGKECKSRQGWHNLENEILDLSVQIRKERGLLPTPASV